MIVGREQYTAAVRVVKALEARIESGTATAHEADRSRAGAEEIVAYEWADRNTTSASAHARLEVAAVLHRGRPLDHGEPVPGCPCPDCTGIKVVDVRPANTRDHERDPLPVQIARNVRIMEVADRLGIEHRRGWARCPFHEDRDPSLHLNPKKQAAFCNPCGRSWDGIGLAMAYLHLEFHEAVKEMARWTGWREAA